MKRRTNPELVESFRNLLTKGFQADPPEQGVDDFDTADWNLIGLKMTKAWRSKLWREFKEIELRLCPVPEVTNLNDGE